MRKRPAVTGPGVGGEHISDDAHHEDNTTATHVAVALEAFLRGERLTRLEAWRRYGDGAFNTTVSKIQARHGVRIDREMIRVPGRRRSAKVAQYWIAEDQHDAARRALATELAGPRGRRTPCERDG